MALRDDDDFKGNKERGKTLQGVDVFFKPFYCPTDADRMFDYSNQLDRCGLVAE
jgi:hypothetical protein